jgi:hypothetical protein
MSMKSVTINVNGARILSVLLILIGSAFVANEIYVIFTMWPYAPSLCGCEFDRALGHKQLAAPIAACFAGCVGTVAGVLLGRRHRFAVLLYGINTVAGARAIEVFGVSRLVPYRPRDCVGLAPPVCAHKPAGSNYGWNPFFGPQLTLPLAVLTGWLVAAWLHTGLASVLNRPIKGA